MTQTSPESRSYKKSKLLMVTKKTETADPKCDIATKNDFSVIKLAKKNKNQFPKDSLVGYLLIFPSLHITHT